MSNKREIEIFWTGGFDSSFRVCQLSRFDVTITPYYMSNKRPSEQRELNAINTIKEKLLKDPRTKATFNPLVYIPYESRKTNEAVTNAYNKLRKLEYLGNQYIFLGIFALEHKGIELSIQNGGNAKRFIQNHGTLIEVEDECGNYFVLDKENSEPECYELFGQYHFPIMAYTKKQIKQKYIEMGLEDIINDTWFCYLPINGKPCGFCNPCRYAIEQGMTERFTDAAIRRYVIEKNSRRMQEKS
ncbi:MAG: 7-cyano-7-deazaguanine synthase [Ruminococcus sp.]|nr:7-cyano-7-deazaguanine synthase [Ruminococcus sp.]